MKKNLIKVLGILLLIILQFTFFSKLSVLTFVPNLVFVISIVLLLRGFLSDSLLVAVLGGLFLDLTSSFRFGFYTFVIILILLFLNFIILKNIPTLNLFLIFLIIFVIFISIDLVMCLIFYTMPAWQMIVDGIVNGLWGIIVYFILEKFTKQEEIKFS